MKTDNQILEICCRVLAKGGFRVSKMQGGYTVYHDSTPASEGKFCWDIWQIVDFADLARERQAEYKQAQRQWQRRPFAPFF